VQASLSDGVAQPHSLVNAAFQCFSYFSLHQIPSESKQRFSTVWTLDRPLIPHSSSYSVLLDRLRIGWLFALYFSLDIVGFGLRAPASGEVDGRRKDWRLAGRGWGGMDSAMDGISRTPAGSQLTDLRYQALSYTSFYVVYQLYLHCSLYLFV